MSRPDNPKRRAILAAAERAFIAQGYAGASIEAIAEAAPASKPTLYKHFKSKQELFSAMIADRCRALLGTLAGVQTKNSEPAAALTAIAHAFIDLIYTDEALQLYRLIIAEQQHFPELGEQVYRSGPEPVLCQLSAYLAELQTRGILTINDVDTASSLFLGMLKGDRHFRCLLGLQNGIDEADKNRLADAAVSLFLKGHGYRP